MLLLIGYDRLVLGPFGFGDAGRKAPKSLCSELSDPLVSHSLSCAKLIENSWRVEGREQGRTLLGGEEGPSPPQYLLKCAYVITRDICK